MQPCICFWASIIAHILYRELATQIHAVLLSLLAFHGPSAVALKLPDESSEDSGAPPNAPYPPSTLRVMPQLLLGGTTTPAAVGEIVRVGLRNPVKIAVKVKGVGGGEDRRTPAR